jgi:uncharacterized protein YeeX (DUF496 family)
MNNRKEAHLLVAALAMHAYIRQGMPTEFVADAAFNMADDLISKYDDDQGIIAALKKTRKK